MRSAGVHQVNGCTYIDLLQHEHVDDFPAFPMIVATGNLRR